MVIAAAIMLGAGILTELLAVMGAPLGYQDDRGFHVGAERDEHEDRGSRVQSR
jgi:hypothetical protein